MVQYRIVRPGGGVEFVKSANAEKSDSDSWLICSNGSTFDSAFAGLRMHPAPMVARQWFPCFDAPDKLFTADIDITVDYGLVAVCSGDLISQARIVFVASS